MIVIAEVSQLGADSRSQAAIVDGEPLPRSVLERLACDAEISPVLFGTPGEVLWQGRSTRTATRAQWQALIARDHGCVLCGAGPARCEAHHLEPWSALGATDIDNLALVCARHHHELHDTHSTLTCDDGVWMLRPRAGPLTRAA